MSKDPTPTPPPKGGTPETLEDAVYRSSLSEGNASVKGANPIVSALFTVVTYGVIAGLGYWVATQTKVGKAVVKKTMGIDLTEQKEDEPPPPPPPPPPAAAAPVVVARVDKPSDAPPPPPPDPSKDIVPEIAPREIPKEDLSTRYAVAAGSAAAGAGGGVAGGGVAGTGMAIAGAQSSSAGKVVDFDYTQMKVKSRPAAPTYPPIARMAKIQGTVVVEMVVGTDGVPVSAKALEGPPQLRPSSEQFALQWRFEPAMQNGAPVQSRFRLTVNFKLM